MTAKLVNVTTPDVLDPEGSIYISRYNNWNNLQETDRTCVGGKIWAQATPLRDLNGYTMDFVMNTGQDAISTKASYLYYTV